MPRRLLIAALLAAIPAAAQDIDLKLYSEFQRVQPDGQVRAVDKAEFPREILSPGLIRNAYTTFRIAVTGHPKATYFIAVQTNPDQIFNFRVYREATAAADDSLTPETKPAYFFGVLPDSKAPRVTQTYLLDIWTPADAPVQTVRFEVLIKRAYWTVVPMEVRVLAGRVPSLPAGNCCDALPGVERASDDAAWHSLLQGLAGGVRGASDPPASSRAIVWRNAMQDAALIQSLTGKTRFETVELVWSKLENRLRGSPAPQDRGAEAYLDLRGAIWQAASKAVSAQNAGVPVQR